MRIFHTDSKIPSCSKNNIADIADPSPWQALACLVWNRGGMRHLRIDLSNRLTDYGIRLFYRKLFDSAAEYDEVFFSDPDTLRKLRLYYSGGYIESVSESIAIPEYRYLHLEYRFSDLPAETVTSIVIEDGSGRILEIDGQHISAQLLDGTDGITCISCRFVIDRNSRLPAVLDGEKVRWNPVVLTDEGLKFVYESLANLRNEKIGFFFTGNGDPSNDPANCHISHLLDDIKVSAIDYDGRYCVLSGRKPFPYNSTSLNELGLGFWVSRKAYLRNYIATMDRNWEGSTFPIDRKEEEDPNTLEFDHPVLSLRAKDSDYLCVWYSGSRSAYGETVFPNFSFSAKFYVNLLYDIWYDEDSVEWLDSETVTPS